jgi:isopenicillin N synthase-like dioxygenase
MYSDLNFLTIHGKSRYPGLFVWLRSGEKIQVAVPEGHLLLQAGKQFEILTGGHVTCGFHEVVYTDEVKRRVEEAQKNGKSTWRISSTLFSHINYDVTLKPLYKFNTPESSAAYPAINAYEQVQEELKAISLR